MEILKKVFLIFITLLILVSSVTRTVLAQSTTTPTSWYNQPFNYWYIKVFDDKNPDEIFGERYTNAQVQWIVYSLISLVLPDKLLRCTLTRDASLCTDTLKEIAADINTSDLALAPRKSLGFKEFMLSDRSMSGIGYIKEKIDGFSIVPTAYAQTEGFGFRNLGSVQAMWRTFRNFAYLFFVLVTIVFAFMIMFRVKISPQTIVTVQSALPKVIIGLIGVTFSFAIAGFLIDIMYVVLGLIAQLFSEVVFPFDVSWNIFTGQVGLMIVFLVHFILFIVAVLFSFVFFALSSIINASIAAALGTIVLLLGIIILLILMIIYVWNWIKLVWLMIKTVANIFLAVIFSPITITFGILGKGGGLTSYIKNLAANLAVFPVVGALLLLSFHFLFWAMAISVKGIVEDNILVDAISAIGRLINPDFTPVSIILTGSIWNPPFISEGFLGFVFAGVGLSLIMLTPKVADAIKSFIQGREFDYGTALGEAARQPVAVAGTATEAVGALVPEHTGGREISRVGRFLSTIGRGKL